MDASDVADAISGAVEEEEGAAAGQRRAANERFRRNAAVAIGVLAMLLAITGLGGDNAGGNVTNENILATDSWAFYQAHSIRQTSTQLAADELDLLLKSNGALPTELRVEAEQRLAGYRATVARLESDPVEQGGVGEGKRELTERARGHEAARARAQRQADNFDDGAALFQIAIVLASVSIVALSRPLLLASLALGALAALLLLNGFVLLVPLPF